MVSSRRIVCPSCEAKLKIAETLPAGKAIQCPKCETSFRVPGVKRELAEAKAATARPRKAAPPPETDEDDDREEERPRKKSKKKTSKKKPGNALILVRVAVWVFIVVGIGAILAIVFWPPSKKSETVAANGNPEAGQRPFQPEGGSGAEGRAQPAERNPGGDRAGTTGEGNASDRVAGAQQIFQQSCARCHALGNSTTGEEGGRGRGRGPRAPDLTHIGQDSSHTADWLEKFIRDPRSVNSNARMPAFQGKLADADLKSLAVYLAGQK